LSDASVQNESGINSKIILTNYILILINELDMPINNGSDNLQSNSVFDLMKVSKNRYVWRPEKKRNWIALALLTGGLILTLMASLLLKADVEQDARKEFNFTCSELKNKISARMHTQAQLLRSGAAFFVHSDGITRHEWRSFYDNQMIAQNIPGIQEIGYSIIIPPNQLARHEKEIQSEGFPQYSVRPKGKRKIYTSIIYLKPFSRGSFRAFGYDMFSEPVRREAMETARDLNIVAFSRKIMLVQGTMDIQGGVMYAPVYRKEMPTGTIEERRSAIKGWVSSPYRMDDMMSGILDGYETIKEKHTHLKIFDDSSYSEDGLLYDSRKVINKHLIFPLLFSLRTSIAFNNHQWYLLFTQHSSGVSGLDYSKVWYAAAGGTSFSILFFVIYLLLINTNIKAHKLAGELTRDLSQSETKYSSMISNISDVICIIDTDGIVKYSSPNIEKWFGWQPQDLTGTNGWLTIHPDDLEHIQKEFFSLLEKDTSVQIVECRLRCKDGSYKPISLTGTNLINDPVINGVLINYHDITKRKQSEEILRLRESYLSAIIENQSGLFWLKDLGGKVLVVNRNFSDVFGFDRPEALVGKTDFDLWTRELADKYIAEDLRVIQTKKAIIVEESILDKGDVKWFETYKAPIFDNQEIVIGTTGYSIDITERKRAEEALQKSIQRLELAMNVADMAWWEMELPSGSVVFGKRKAEMLGFPPERFKHYKDFTDLVHPDDYEQIMDAMRWHLNGKLDKYETEYRILTSSNEYRWFYDIGSVVEGSSNEMPVRITGLVLDITDRKAAQFELLNFNEELTDTKEKLEKINSEKDRLFSIIAHNLKSPFQGFLGLTESMAENINSFSQTELSDIGREMHITSKNLFRLLSNVLEWACMQQGLINLNPVEIVLSEIISQNIDSIIKRGEQKEIEIIHEVDKNQIVFADETMLNSILRNLLSNAIKFTKQGGKVSVSSKETENNMVEISVTDSGIGMSEDLSEKLFKIDEKVGRKGTNGESSTGLGLLLCKEFVEKHGGRIRVESRKGEGSIFSFTIPAADKNFPYTMD